MRRCANIALYFMLLNNGISAITATSDRFPIQRNTSQCPNKALLAMICVKFCQTWDPPPALPACSTSKHDLRNHSSVHAVSPARWVGRSRGDAVSITTTELPYGIVCRQMHKFPRGFGDLGQPTLMRQQWCMQPGIVSQEGRRSGSNHGGM